MITFAIFFFFAAIAVIFAAMVVLHRNPVVGALSLVASFFALAVMYVLLEAPFLAALQVIVYAGAIMVLFLFVIMLLNLSDEEAEARRRGRALFRIGAWIGGGVLAAELAAVFLRVPFPAPAAPPAGYGGAESVATALFVDYALPFELTSILLLIAVIGTVVLAQRRAS